MTEKKDLGKTSVGMDANIAGMLCYVLGWLTGLVFFLIEKDNKFVRFHAVQSMIVFGFLSIINIALPIIFAMIGMGVIFKALTMLLGWLGLILWVVLMVKAWQGEQFKLPVAGDIAQQKSV
jgi:uncharacterized membrane protein